ncbi:MAG TPA: CPBP family glutamic-type intramembrane protease [Candidatus Moranbacteria bacterium]|nr:CPBP family glutamic-type intramembrane protease [Candidatus Moranbacteria bacterium]
MRYYRKKSFLSRLTSVFIDNKEIAITCLVIIFCLLLSIIFPVNNSVQLLTRNIFFLIIVPILYYKLILGKRFSDLGLILGDKRAGIFWGIILFFVSLLIFYLLYTYTDFKKNYLLSSYVVHNFWLFLLYELLLANLFVFIQEFFWRGFILLYFSKKISYFSIFLQFILFTLMLIPAKNTFWQMAPTLVISLFSGIIVYKSRSILYSWIFALFSLVILDSFIIYHLK